MKTKFLLLRSFIVFIFFTNCAPNEKTQNTASVSSADMAVVSKIDASVNDVTAIAEDQVTMQQSLTAKSIVPFKSILPSCATFTAVLANGTWTRTIDFGTAGCALQNGNILKGKIIISFTNDFTSLTKTISYNFDGFYHNGNLIEGSRTIVQTLSSTSLLAAVHPVSTHSINMTVTFANSTIYTRTGTKVREMIAGYDTPFDWQDNIFLETGNSITSHPNSNVVTSTIITPLEFMMSCNMPFPVQGVVSIAKNNSTGIIDFGNGTCDNMATLTIDGGVTTNITLGK